MNDWYDEAACRGRPIDWWYPGQGDQFAGQVAVMVCRSCPVRSRCLDAALAEERDLPRFDVHGIRGGLTAQARAQLARRARRHPALDLVAEEVEPVRPAPTGRRTWPRLRHVVAL